MNHLSKILLLCLVLASPAISSAHAQKSRSPKAKNSVTITCSCDDPTGKAYASALHDALAASSSYREVGLSEGIENNAIRINIISLSLDDAAQPGRTVLSIVVLHDGAILHQFIETTCNKVPIASCAKTMLAELATWSSESDS
jgi:hypothetical protein